MLFQSYVAYGFIDAICNTVSNIKKHLADFDTCVFRVYLRKHLTYKKSYFHLFASLSEELSDQKIIFQIWSQNQLIFCQKKVSYWKFFFFMNLRFRAWTYIQTSFWLKKHHATSSSQARLVFRIFVNLIFISWHYNNDGMKKLFYQTDPLFKLSSIPKP